MIQSHHNLDFFALSLENYPAKALLNHLSSLPSMLILRKASRFISIKLFYFVFLNHLMRFS